MNGSDIAGEAGSRTVRVLMLIIAIAIGIGFVVGYLLGRLS